MVSRRAWKSPLVFATAVILFCLYSLIRTVDKVGVSRENTTLFAQKLDNVQAVAIVDQHQIVRANQTSVVLDVTGISHAPQRKEIVVHLVSPRICQRPRFFGRLSGPTVSIIHWNRIINSSTDVINNNEIRGYYNVSLHGEYYIEIIALVCEDLNWTTNLEEVCLEDPRTHRITHKDAHISVPPSAISYPINKLTKGYGYWRWSWDNETKPLLTRHQPAGCRGKDMPDMCHEHTSLTRFAPYEFVTVATNPGDETDPYFISKRSRHLWRNYRICLVGLSHSREMALQMRTILTKYNGNISQDDVRVSQIEARYPTEIRGRVVRKVSSIGCNQTVVAVGQWALGKAPRFHHPPTPFPTYRSEVIQAVKRLKGAGVHNISLRSIHYNPLGDLKTTCPPKDWRTPMAIDRYNDILRNISGTLSGVRYLDTTFIMSPLWDSAPDWCHYANEAGMQESRFILQTLLP